MSSFFFRMYVTLYEIGSNYTIFTPLDLSRSNGKKYEPINVDYHIIYYPLFFEGYDLCPVITSSESYHWTRWIADTCPLLNTCPNLDISSDNFHWILLNSHICVYS